MFIKHSPREILNLNFEKMTVYLTAFFRFNGPLLLHQTTSFTYNDVIIYLECSVWIQLISYAEHEFENRKAAY